MKLLKWAETIKQPVPVSKEDILNRVEKAEIIHLVTMGLWAIGLLIGLFFIMVAPKGTKLTWLGLYLALACSTGYLESTIKGYLKLERYKAIWEQNKLMQSEVRKMQAEDL